MGGCVQQSQFKQCSHYFTATLGREGGKEGREGEREGEREGASVQESAYTVTLVTVEVGA